MLLRKGAVAIVGSADAVAFLTAPRGQKEKPLATPARGAQGGDDIALTIDVCHAPTGDVPLRLETLKPVGVDFHALDQFRSNTQPPLLELVRQLIPVQAVDGRCAVPSGLPRFASVVNVPVVTNSPLRARPTSAPRKSRTALGRQSLGTARTETIHGRSRDRRYLRPLTVAAPYPLPPETSPCTKPNSRGMRSTRTARTTSKGSTISTYRFAGTMRQAKWRRGWDSNPRTGSTVAGFQDRCIQPLCHLSGWGRGRGERVPLSRGRLRNGSKVTAFWTIPASPPRPHIHGESDSLRPA